MNMKGGYGLVYQEVTRNNGIPAAAKGLYAYLAAFCGATDECFPSVETILNEMGMGKDTFYRHINALVAAGVVEKRQTMDGGGRFGRTTYRLTHGVAVSDFPITQNPYTDFTYTESGETNNNIIKKEHILKNNNTSYQEIFRLFNGICVSFPKLTKLSGKRKQTIKARFKSGYTVDDFRRLFELAEGSSFLKGGNGRNWSATFDWLIADANMAKVLDGNYSDKQKGGGGADEKQSGSSFKL